MEIKKIQILMLCLTSVELLQTSGIFDERFTESRHLKKAPCLLYMTDFTLQSRVFSFRFLGSLVIEILWTWIYGCGFFNPCNRALKNGRLIATAAAVAANSNMADITLAVACYLSISRLNSHTRQSGYRTQAWNSTMTFIKDFTMEESRLFMNCF